MAKKGTKRDLFAVTQKAVIYNDDRKFLILKAGEDQDGLDVMGRWGLAGGHIEHTENDLRKSLQRELAEEIGTDVQYEIKEPFFVDRRDFDEHKRIGLGILVKYQGGKIVLDDEEAVEYVWQSAAEVQKNKEYKPWLKGMIAEAEKAIEQAEAVNGWKRALADFDNFKKRQSESQKDFTQYAAQNVVSDILPVLDNFHAATDHIPQAQQGDGWVVGVMHIQSQLEKVLEDHGVKELSVKPGDAFDENTMEAIEETSTQEQKVGKNKEKAQSKNTVAKIVKKGYTMGDKVIRPAVVTVA